MAMRTVMKPDAAAPRRANCRSQTGRMPRGEVPVPRKSQSRAGRPRSGWPLESGVPPWSEFPPSNGAQRRPSPPRTGPSAPSPAVRLRSALAATAAFALAATLTGCSTFGVAPFPEPIRPPFEAEGGTPPPRRPKRRRPAATAPPAACTSPASGRAAWRTTRARTLRAAYRSRLQRRAHGTLH